MKWDEERNMMLKCICEALDLDFCSCSDDVREECNVKLPKVTNEH